MMSNWCKKGVSKMTYCCQIPARITLQQQLLKWHTRIYLATFFSESSLTPVYLGQDSNSPDRNRHLLQSHAGALSSGVSFCLHLRETRIGLTGREAVALL